MYNRKFKVIITLFLVFFTMACTLPFYLAPAPDTEENIVYVEITSTPELDEVSEAENDADEVVDVTPTVSVNLDGPWTIWQGSTEQKLSIDFLQQGYELIGNAASGGGQSILFKGMVSQDGKNVTGTWESTTGTSGNFLMNINDSLSSFSGNLGGGVPFCGTRAESSKPSPCLK
ncbi:MAG: hypothetical protein MUO76_18385 [Anaerolineaceae bacterium]|nr:hypothetical protein [Anaerolineaceae bacterium]